MGALDGLLFGGNFGTGSPAEEAQKPNPLADLLLAAAKHAGSIPERALGASQNALETGNYNPAPALEAAMLPMGTGAIAGVPVRTGEAVLGAGPIRAYHGSPHDFDRFDLSKIGTGEGAQAYGHGLYFAENEGVAKSYRDALSTRTIGGNPVDWSTPEEIAAGWLKIHGGNKPDAIKYLDRIPPAYQSQATRAAADLLRNDAPLKTFDPGKMYEVNINADPAHFLDWDKPLSQSGAGSVVSPIVEKLRGASGMIDRKLGGDPTGEQIYSSLGSPFGRKAVTGSSAGFSDKAGSTDVLREAGIPGIKYLDQGSRTAGQGSSNYVVFNDKLIDIVKKYGLAGLLTPGLFAAATNNPPDTQ